MQDHSMAFKFLDIFKARATEKQMSPETVEILRQSAGRGVRKSDSFV
jgi:hypothetical protein